MEIVEEEFNRGRDRERGTCLAVRLFAVYIRTVRGPMKALRVSENIVPVSDFKAQAADWLRRISETGQPIVITQNGKAAGVLMSPAQFDELTEQVRFLKAIDAGLADSAAGRVHSPALVVAHMKRRAARRKAP